jgi:CheY-like chemotaxis protein
VTESIQQPRILLVDDDVRLRQVIQTVLEDEGLLVEVAGDGLEAVARASARRPALIILDMGLPSLNGQGVASALRAAYGTQVAPILTITAGGKAAESARRVGAYAFLSKPFELEDLLTAVHQGLQLSP